MPSYTQLASEPVWNAQHTPDAMVAELLDPLRAFYGLGPASIGAAGDNNHLYGRHRSYNWDRQSQFCTDRAYGTSDPRDQSGDRNWYRASDVGIIGQKLYDASHRMDALVRSGRAPGVAEWFGTFDGENVVGWFEGYFSASDDSHLSHLHLGFWNESAGDAELMRTVYQTITGTPPPREDEDMGKITPLGVYQTAGLEHDGIYYAWISDGAVYYADTVVGPALFPRLAKQGFDIDVIYLPKGVSMDVVGSPAS